MLVTRDREICRKLARVERGNIFRHGRRVGWGGGKILANHFAEFVANQLCAAVSIRLHPIGDIARRQFNHSGHLTGHTRAERLEEKELPRFGSRERAAQLNDFAVPTLQVLNRSFGPFVTDQFHSEYAARAGAGQTGEKRRVPGAFRRVGGRLLG